MDIPLAMPNDSKRNNGSEPAGGSGSGSPNLQPPPSFQPDARDRLQRLNEAFLARLCGRLGRTAQPNLTYFSHRVATTAIQRLRLDALKGAALTATGEAFLGEIAAYLAAIAVRNWERRGLRVEGRVGVNAGAGARASEIYFEASRERDGQREVYGHDFLRDTRELLLSPPDWLPYLKEKVYAIQSLTLPSPEQLYLYGVCLLQSPSAREAARWPTGGTPGGRPEDFERSKELLVDDLHEDCGLPRDDAGLRALSHWIVFPPYGWTQNAANDYNMLTIFSQISEQPVVTREAGLEYLRALLRCQAPDIRNLAARCLMVYRVPPQDAIEASHYRQAMNWDDNQEAAQVMAKYQHKLEGVEATQGWWRQILEERDHWLQRTPPALSHRTAAEGDAEYVGLGQLRPEDVAGGLRGLASLRRRFPGDWVLQVIEASYFVRGPEPERGESVLRRLIQEPPDCFEGHSRLGTYLKYQPGRAGEALAVYEDSLRRWPWNHQGVDACLWILTQGMTQLPPPASQAA